MKIKKTDRPGLSIVSKVGVFSLSLLCAFSAVYFYSPVIKSNATNTGDMEVGFILKPYLNLTLDKSELSLSGRTGTFVQGNVNVTVATNSSYGYSVSLEDTDNNTDLLPDNIENGDKFESNFTETVTSSTMPENSWGYSLNATDFYEIVPFGMPDLIGKSNEATTSESENATTRVDFGAKISDFMIADQYSDQILFTAYVNGQDGAAYEINDDGSTEETILSNPYTPTYNMQNFECETLNIGQSAKAIDIRDNNKYVIKRLDNGTCWMTSGLRLKNKTLTPEDSDVASNFVLRDSGDISEFEPDENTDPKTANVVYDENGNVFYSWYAATAGDSANAISYESDEESGYSYGTTSMLKSLNTSICPKGWRLPSFRDGTTINGGRVGSVEESGFMLPAKGAIFNGSYGIRTKSDDDVRVIDTRGGEAYGGTYIRLSMYWPSYYFGVMDNYATYFLVSEIMTERYGSSNEDSRIMFGVIPSILPVSFAGNDYNGRIKSGFDYDEKLITGANVVCLTGNITNNGRVERND